MVWDFASINFFHIYRKHTNDEDLQTRNFGEEEEEGRKIHASHEQDTKQI